MKNLEAPEHTAVRVALWRALHVQIDPAPHILTDELGARIVNEKNWRNRADMQPDFSKSMRASIVARARFVEDLVEEQAHQSEFQYVILGAGLDTFAQRRPDLAPRVQIFEVDQPGPQVWKQKRLKEMGLKMSEALQFVPVDFESGQSWWDQLLKAGFDAKKTTLIASTGVSMYLTKEANFATFQKIASLPRATFVMTFLLALELLEPKEKAIMEFVMKKASESGTPFLSLYSPEDILQSAIQAGFKSVDYISAENLYQNYFADRRDGLDAGRAEAFLLAKTLK